MSKKFVIGDRSKDEWISVLDTEKKKLEFTNHLASAKEYLLEEDAQLNLQKIQKTGFVTKLAFSLTVCRADCTLSLFKPHGQNVHSFQCFIEDRYFDIRYALQICQCTCSNTADS